MRHVHHSLLRLLVEGNAGVEPEGHVQIAEFAAHHKRLHGGIQVHRILAGRLDTEPFQQHSNRVGWHAAGYPERVDVEAQPAELQPAFFIRQTDLSLQRHGLHSGQGVEGVGLRSIYHHRTVHTHRTYADRRQRERLGSGVLFLFGRLENVPVRRRIRIGVGCHTQALQRSVMQTKLPAEKTPDVDGRHEAAESCQRICPVAAACIQQRTGRADAVVGGETIVRIGKRKAVQGYANARKTPEHVEVQARVGQGAVNGLRSSVVHETAHLAGIEHNLQGGHYYQEHSGHNGQYPEEPFRTFRHFYLNCLKKSLPLSSTSMKAGKSSTVIFHTASMPSSGNSTHSMLRMLLCESTAATPPIVPR